jgi:hypothetical protein
MYANSKGISLGMYLIGVQSSRLSFCCSVNTARMDLPFCVVRPRNTTCVGLLKFKLMFEFPQLTLSRNYIDCFPWFVLQNKDAFGLQWETLRLIE